MDPRSSARSAQRASHNPLPNSYKHALTSAAPRNKNMSKGKEPKATTQATKSGKSKSSDVPRDTNPPKEISDDNRSGGAPLPQPPSTYRPVAPPSDPPTAALSRNQGTTHGLNRSPEPNTPPSNTRAITSPLHEVAPPSEQSTDQNHPSEPAETDTPKESHWDRALTISREAKKKAARERNGEIWDTTTEPDLMDLFPEGYWNPSLEPGLMDVYPKGWW
ncbi:hypothetical protein ACLMJK_006509 [Lecanora helva]